MKQTSKENLAEVGFEPTASGLQVQCSTIWTIQLYDKLDHNRIIAPTDNALHFYFHPIILNLPLTLFFQISDNPERRNISSAHLKSCVSFGGINVFSRGLKTSKYSLIAIHSLLMPSEAKLQNKTKQWYLF